MTVAAATSDRDAPAAAVGARADMSGRAEKMNGGRGASGRSWLGRAVVAVGEMRGGVETSCDANSSAVQLHAVACVRRCAAVTVCEGDGVSARERKANQPERNRNPLTWRRLSTGYLSAAAERVDGRGEGRRADKGGEGG